MKKIGPNLPLELERKIFELAAETHRGTMLSLLRVAHRVHVWIEPMLYLEVSLRTPKKAQIFLATVRSKPPSFLSLRVRDLYLHLSPSNLKIENDILHLCSGITYAVLCFRSSDLSLLPALSAIRPHRISLAIFCPQTKIDLTHPVFSNITHLDLLDTNRKHQGAIMSLLNGKLPTPPQLTHLLLSSSNLWAPSVHRLLYRLPTAFKVLIVRQISWPDNNAAPHFGPIHGCSDMRAIECKNMERYWNDWPRGQLEMWTHAEEYIALRRSSVTLG